MASVFGKSVLPKDQKQLLELKSSLVGHERNNQRLVDENNKKLKKWNDIKRAQLGDGKSKKEALENKLKSLQAEVSDVTEQLKHFTVSDMKTCQDKIARYTEMKRTGDARLAITKKMIIEVDDALKKITVTAPDIDTEHLLQMLSDDESPSK